MSKHKEEKDAPAPEPSAAPSNTPPGSSELDVLNDRLLRLQADFDNFRKRSARERAESSLAAREEFFQELIPVLDHFELGLKAAAGDSSAHALHHGFQMVYEQIMAFARKFGLQPLDVHEGHFDPHLHEAVTHISSDEYAADEIIQQTRRGYRLGEKLLRAVQVVVSSGPGAPRDDEVKSGGQPKGAPNGGG